MVDFEDDIQGSNSFYNNSAAQFRLVCTVKEYEEVRQSWDCPGYISSRLPVNVIPGKFTVGIHLYPNGDSAARGYTSVYISNEGMFTVWLSYNVAVITRANVQNYFRSNSGITKFESKKWWGFRKWFPINVPEEENETFFPNGCLQILLEGMAWSEEPLDKTKHFSDFLDCNVMLATTLHQNDTHTDAILSVGDEQFQVHKNILSAKSSVFQEMFEEKSQNIIIIPDAKEEVFREVIHFLYTSTVTSMIDTMLSEVIQFARKYQLNCLAELCQIKMLKNICVHNCLEYLQIADSCGASDLKEKTLKYITENRKHVLENEQWNVFKSKSSKLQTELLERFMAMD